jgi:hypothetical protein
MDMHVLTERTCLCSLADMTSEHHVCMYVLLTLMWSAAKSREHVCMYVLLTLIMHC